MRALHSIGIRNFAVIPFALISLAGGATAWADRPLRFNRDVRPILSDKCFACHGPDADTVEGGLRLDLRDEATEASDAIVPGNASDSEFVRRIVSDDPDERMPPPESHKHLDASEITLLRRWIDEGAIYEPHWAYVPLVRPTLPASPDVAATPHVIDQFIARRLSEETVQPVSQADRVTLIRRLSFDLTGLPPTLDEVNAFVNDTSDDAYEKLVDRMLRSPRYGERMAIYWLDLVRYADTVGYHGDQNVSQSPYRDYVIKAFNANMPYDQFVREQLAGDLLPSPTIDQLVASGYNRLNQTTEEGGAQAKEYLSIYFADRVRNVSQVFMGATVGCAQCHDHKYDPYTARDFYSLGAFFADLEERGVYSARSRPPSIRVPRESDLEKIEAIDQRIASVTSEQQSLRQTLISSQPQWETEAKAQLSENTEVETVWIDDAQDTGGNSDGDWTFVSSESAPVHSGTASRRQSSEGLVQHFFLGAKKTAKVSADTRFFVWVYLDPKNPPESIMLQWNDGQWDHRAVWGSDAISYGRRTESWAGYQRRGELPETGKWVRLEVDANQVGLTEQKPVVGMAFTQFGGLVYWDKAGWIAKAGIPQPIADALQISAHDRNETQAAAVREYYLANSPPVIELEERLKRLQAERTAVEESSPMTLISKSVTPRTIRVQPRGNWMDDSGEIVEPAIPAFLGKLETNGRATRLDLANWLCRSDNVLTSRTMVNRLWYLMFGRGICASVDDFGGQGTFPSYPDLLDWLAVEFVESGWDIKYILRVIVTSETYRRSSRPSEQLRKLDPYNELFARQGRFRIDAEMVRDNALAISGLLVEQIGGKSVKPYQPEGYYAQLNFPRRTYVADQGNDQYRRGVYTHWQRTFLHPMLKAFDAPSREECTAARAKSNTPLQALSLLNDPTFIEAARVFAARIMRESGPAVDQRIEWAYQTTLSREPETEVASELRQIYDKHLAHYMDNQDEASKLISEGNAAVATDLPAAELAAWSSVARVLLNLHETMMRY
ncbi:PSD1 and planctomycete cytochrome C domain-containing protein [Novipirellula sp.]|uniref:PSD1 and planctomycete cytochrome C domain-containing protein n=1 Tax=Novipirellula sp. TaxID=2795430 RepID=UPI0035627E1F